MCRFATSGRSSVQIFLTESPLSRHKLINFGLVCVLLATILALGIVIVCKGASKIGAEFNNNGCAAIRAVKCSFLFAHSKDPCDGVVQPHQDTSDAVALH
jgi:hypothetical protein